jgi:4-hydroxybenzoate polyprenyltransferase
MNPALQMHERTHVLLELGRVSNLPTVWSNCLAAWILAGAALQSRFLLVCSAATCLYLGGMFLNDAFDVRFDRKYRPERPIVSGRIEARNVWGLGVLWLALGWLALLPLGRAAAALGLLLLAAIVFYDAVHKRTVLAPLIMAGCRFLLYLVAAAAAGGLNSGVGAAALALAAYITGLSYLARTERGLGRPWWPLPLLFAPVLPILLAPQSTNLISWISVGLFGLWVGWCLQSSNGRMRRVLPGGVSGLLAGIALADWVAQSSMASGFWWAFLLLFLVALLLQQRVAAT